MNLDENHPDRSDDAMSTELISLISTRNPALNIGELAIKLQLSRKETVLLLVNLECQEILTWNSATKTYSSNPESLKQLLQSQTRTITRQTRSQSRPDRFARAA